MVRTGTRRTGGDRDGHAGCSRGRSVLSRQLLHPLAGVVLNAHAHQLAELMRPFVGKGVAGEVALPLSGHESSVQQHAPDAWKRYPVCKSCPLMGLGAPVARPSEPCHEHAWLRTPVQRRAQACAQRWRCVRERDPIRSAGATTLLCDDEKGEPRWHRGHRRRAETAAPQCGGVFPRADGKAVQILDARDDRKVFDAAHIAGAVHGPLRSALSRLPPAPISLRTIRFC